jgi:nucleoside-diphosphate-sugar epimerase
MKRLMFVLGATGFIGKSVLREALQSGWQVKALVRSQEAAQDISALGAVPVIGNAGDAKAWMSELQGAEVLIDLLQPKIPQRLTLTKVESLSAARRHLTQEVLGALKQLRPEKRPLLVSVSGTDDLEPDEKGRIGPDSPLKRRPTGFAHIGIPVRRLIEQSGLPAVFVYLGSVYGPGKTFADLVAPRIAKGRWKVIGNANNRLALIHVDDAARGLVHIAGLRRETIEQQTFLLSDVSPVPAQEFFGHAAALMGARPPGHVPASLASFIAGSVLVETLTRDTPADPSALIATGFGFKYPSYREGLPPTLKQLGYSQAAPRHEAGKHRLPLALLFAVMIGVLAAENLLQFRLSVPYMLAASGGLPILDMRLSYTPAEAYHLFDVLGAGGRADYLTLLWTVDLAIPFLVMTFLWNAISRGPLRRIRLLGLAGGAADYLENIAITALLLHYPRQLDWLVYTASALTGIKQILYLLGLVLTLIGFGLKITGWKPQRIDKSGKLSPM